MVRSVPPSPNATYVKVSDIPGVKDLWAETTGDPAVRVAFLDGNVDTSHKSLSGAPLDHVSIPPFTATGKGLARYHGTHLVSLVLGQHGTEVEGLAPRCQGLVIPIFGNGDSSGLVVSQLDLARGILYALEQGAHLINISGGQPEPSGQPHPLLKQAVRECEASETVIVAAAGNDACDCLHVPAAISSVVVAGAVDLQGHMLALTNWGQAYSGHGVLAPGKDILGARDGGGIAPGTGTSFAAAIVTGVAALLLSLQLKKGSRPSPHAVRNAILGGAMQTDREQAENATHRQPNRLNIIRARVLLSEEMEGVDDSLAPDLESSDLEPAEHAAWASDAFAVPEVQAAGSLGDTSEFDELGLDMREEVEGNSDGEFENEFSTAELANGSESSQHLHHRECPDCREASSPALASQPQLVYAIGQPGYNLVSEARRSSLSQHMGAEKLADNAADLLGYLDGSPWESDAVEWVLTLDATPIYAIRPEGAFAREGYDRLRQAVHDYVDGAIERISVAGVLTGEAQLSSGQIVPVVRPDLRCLYSWTTAALFESVAGAAPAESSAKKTRDEYAQRAGGVRNFLERVYEDLRNLGVLPQHRALNYAATNALNAAKVFDSALQEQMQLDTIDVEPSPICPPGEDCWDVRLTFFNPSRQFEQARKVFKVTVDVAEACPVMVGAVRSWYVR